MISCSPGGQTSPSSSPGERGGVSTGEGGGSLQVQVRGGGSLQSVSGWKLFGRVSRLSPSKQPRLIQQEFEARQVAARCSPSHNASGHQSPTHNTSGHQSRRTMSTTALILEDRPPYVHFMNLPSKSSEETQRHREQYELMVLAARRRELKEAQRDRQQQEQRVRQEEQVYSNTLIWNQHILPRWDTRVQRAHPGPVGGGLPPSVRGRVWSRAIGNELSITPDLYEIFVSRARGR
ncbi:TBC1 domain family member 12 [Dissostichus eleginoides]|uniref:TBC1 domain family member 12 n=1 Tax=Dissostichus eleginoides TaxID=100907 RepID=A0AAD9BDI5_DISEL|nr:TBC1 domain family member 12 [Dissostichus eleginoides]